MAINSITYHSVATSLLPEGSAAVPKWIGFLVVAFLLGAAAGGYVFGWVGDRFGRSRAMALSIAVYSVFSLVSLLSPGIEIFWLLRFLTCMGIGGMWPNGMALLQEAWPNTAKPILAGILGTAANVGIALFAYLCIHKDVNPGDWQWTYMAGGTPILLAIACWLLVPESPKWLRQQSASNDKNGPAKVGMGEVFSPPYRRLTLIGIVLAFVPLFGGWGVANWASYWAAEADEETRLAQIAEKQDGVTKADDTNTASKKTATNKKAQTSFNRAWTGSISSLLGGALAMLLGRRICYAVLCVCAFTCTQMLYSLPDPNSGDFQTWVRALGFFSGFFFGWLPLCLPEMFPTRVRSTGGGVSFNFGRIIVAALILLTAFALKDQFEGRYDLVGRVCGFMYLTGIVAVLLMPTQKEAADPARA
ncbi:MAG: MFS transporter [Fuerstiella sp.]|nr:MFS transporter [Fuerstiella sp.]